MEEYAYANVVKRRSKYTMEVLGVITSKNAMEDNVLVDTAVRQSLERAATRDLWSTERDQSDQPRYCYQMHCCSRPYPYLETKENWA